MEIAYYVLVRAFLFLDLFSLVISLLPRHFRSHSQHFTVYTVSLFHSLAAQSMHVDGWHNQSQHVYITFVGPRNRFGCFFSVPLIVCIHSFFLRSIYLVRVFKSVDYGGFFALSALVLISVEMTIKTNKSAAQKLVGRIRNIVHLK